MTDIPTDLLYFGDNLTWLRNRDRFPDASVDLVYLDPPFNSNRSYNVLFKESDVRESEAQMHAFEDTWTWSQDVQDVADEFWLTAPEKPQLMLKSMIAALGRNDVTAYLTMMAPRLVELHRVLKPTGSLYLHCDPTASHYLKMLMDSIFDPRNFRNEVVWQRTTAKGLMTRQLPNNHDVILSYQRSAMATWNQEAVFTPYDLGALPEKTADKYRMREPDGRLYELKDITNPNPNRPNLTYEFLGVTKVWRWTKDRMQAAYDAGLIVQSRPGAIPRVKRYLDQQRGKPLSDVWTDIPPINSQAKERLGYPTQKPLALLERIIEQSSNVGDIVLDPFCGCGTAVHAAQKLDRRWIGIDITPLATNLIRTRLEQAFAGLKVSIEGWPSDMAGAVALAAQEDKYHFQDWAVIQCGARPAGGERKKGADRGVDGVIPFLDGRTPKRGIVSVKAGATGPAHVRELGGVVSRDEDAAFGVFICLNDPTQPMIEEALNQGTWISEFDGKTYPKMQILSSQDLINHKPVRMPPSRTAVFAQASRERIREGQQGKLSQS